MRLHAFILSPLPNNQKSPRVQRCPGEAAFHFSPAFLSSSSRCRLLRLANATSFPSPPSRRAPFPRSMCRMLFDYYCRKGEAEGERDEHGDGSFRKAHLRSLPPPILLVLYYIVEHKRECSATSFFKSKKGLLDECKK